ncbi:FkbM family methyltransferase [Synoicihabitans lomoniglobus]|uniref:FkbM family methyltransferase n=1 Tax=Synoicihabitans lomoniglobus TaxID=2909285 RepID=A0AAF0I5G6_9BACT|nr:FkbM family methyltransferase [Opitutaceae bacterium LMO-M01]WED67348.1 FkbM family methyltransferase [Opitutaceae bacterium LMO-M01]
MKQLIISFLDVFLAITHLEYLPVRVRSGIAAGAKWTLYPWSAYWRTGQEPEIHQAMENWDDLSGKVVWDLGAHFGIYSVGLARRTGPAGQVVAFEPNPFSFARLERHRRMNSLSWMKCINAAVTSQPGEIELLSYGTLRSTTTHLPYEGETVTAEAAPIKVKAVSLDQLVQSREIRLPNFIKVDVEGHAQSALEGARMSLAKTRPTLILAFHSQAEIDGTMSILKPLDYSLQILSETKSGDGSLIGKDVLFTPNPQSTVAN